MKPLPIGIDNFKDLIKNDCYYIDKTAVIEELLVNKGYGIVLFPRPRRFGKSLFISMLEEFFDIEKKETNKNLFKGLYISRSKVYKDNLNSYPVIHLDFKDLKYNTFDRTYIDIKSLMSEVYRERKYLLKILDKDEKLRFNIVLNREGNIEDY